MKMKRFETVGDNPRRQLQYVPSKARLSRPFSSRAVEQASSTDASYLTKNNECKPAGSTVFGGIRDFGENPVVPRSMDMKQSETSIPFH
jgi:hypothetical protein